MTSIIRERQVLGAGRPRLPRCHDLQHSFYAMSLSCSWCDRPRMRSGSSAAAPIQLGESAWCDVMHVLHSFIRPRSIETCIRSAHSAFVAFVDLARFDCCETCLGGLDRSAHSVRCRHLCSMFLLESPCVSLGRAQLQVLSTALHPELLFSSLSGPLLPPGVVIGCHQTPGAKLAARMCALSQSSPESPKQRSQGRPCTPVEPRNLTSDF